ncbi:hypothetical protein H696_01690 [Fonticula alba]|uniref:C2H2-type domain-containing protein n=1 Tax=Fonticula alba TaxID=691883 RepID=A0A058ZEE4_FONAL|nr:hypothetical protein H696_01690 [Fonticula alba]KCV72293.1 hypothetical protein H696_01690 [Fonticula alba]|eukprot:XP_009493871.1 hypothetical protein H696_01690 [Fonticula alba]
MCTTRDAQCIAAGNTGTILDVSSYRGACPQALASCRMTCLLPYDTTCKFLGTGFRNGTRCGSDGFCYGGSCSEASFLQWVEGNLILFCVLAGIAALLVLIFLVWGCRQAGRKQLRPLSIGIPGRTGGGKKGAKNQASSGKKQSQKNSKPSATKGTSGQGTIRCPLCPLSFPGESHLTLHLDRDHS